MPGAGLIRSRPDPSWPGSTPPNSPVSGNAIRKAALIRKINRFANARRLLKENIERAQDLWLDQAPPLRILDLGCGPNYFLFVCRALGHDGVSVDIDEQPLFRETTEMLGIPRVIHRIEAGVPLPDLGGRFDLVTAHRICFYKMERGTGGKWIEWTPDDWRFFIHDVRSRLLNPEGRLLLDFNPRPGEGRYMTPEVRDTLRDAGAVIVRSKALLAADPAHTPRFRL